MTFWPALIFVGSIGMIFSPMKSGSSKPSRIFRSSRPPVTPVQALMSANAVTSTPTPLAS